VRTPADAERSFEACLDSYLEDLKVRRYSRSYGALAAFALGRLVEHLPRKRRRKNNFTFPERERGCSSMQAVPDVGVA